MERKKIINQGHCEKEEIFWIKIENGIWWPGLVADGSGTFWDEDAIENRGNSKDEEENRGNSKDEEENRGNSKDGEEDRGNGKDEEEKRGNSKDEEENRGNSKDGEEDRGNSKDEVENRGNSKDEVEYRGNSKDEEEKRGNSKDEVENRGNSKDEVENSGNSKDGKEDRGNSKDEVENSGNSKDGEEDRGNSKDGKKDHGNSKDGEEDRVSSTDREEDCVSGRDDEDTVSGTDREEYCVSSTDEEENNVCSTDWEMDSASGTQQDTVSSSNKDGDGVSSTNNKRDCISNTRNKNDTVSRGSNNDSDMSDTIPIYTAQSGAFLQNTLTSKQHCCMYCEKLYAKVPRHMEQVHSEEHEVAKILAMPKMSKRRRGAWVILVGKGDFKHNLKARTENKGMKAKVAQVLMAINSGKNTYKGQDLDEIDVNVEGLIIVLEWKDIKQDFVFAVIEDSDDDVVEKQNNVDKDVDFLSVSKPILPDEGTASLAEQKQTQRHHRLSDSDNSYQPDRKRQKSKRGEKQTGVLKKFQRTSKHMAEKSTERPVCSEKLKQAKRPGFSVEEKHKIERVMEHYLK
ncbi:PREDICTED: uncharacterized protein LOC106819109, partial [Priapulus caudatus]|uniref:Uncharacterized protein LOC106819109 n=1 Tax=Priapulus caudatus TaxID=37621 RepID=A0ABM1F488_PRICU